MGAGKVIIEERTAESSIEQANPGADIQTVSLVITLARNYGDFTVYMGVHAESLYTFSGGIPLNNDTVTIDGKVYTFQTTLTDVDGNVDIGADAEGTLDNLLAAIILGAGAGTAYAASMTLHPTFTAEKRSTSVMAAIVKAHGVSTLATTESATNITVDGVTVDAVADALTITFGLSPDGTNYFDDPTTTAIADASAISRNFTQAMQTLRLTGNSPRRLTTMVRGIA